LGQISEHLGIEVSSVKNVIIWGNHSSTQYPDVNHAVIVTENGETPVMDLVDNLAWFAFIFSLLIVLMDDQGMKICAQASVKPL
jgi:malate/lactate dehydrogenase